MVRRQLLSVISVTCVFQMVRRHIVGRVRHQLLWYANIFFFISFLPAFVPFLECIIPCIIDLARQIMKEDFLTCIKVCAQSQKCPWMELVAVKVEGDKKEI